MPLFTIEACSDPEENDVVHEALAAFLPLNRILLPSSPTQQHIPRTILASDAVLDASHIYKRSNRKFLCAYYSPLPCSDLCTMCIVSTALKNGCRWLQGSVMLGTCFEKLLLMRPCPVFDIS